MFYIGAWCRDMKAMKGICSSVANSVVKQRISIWENVQNEYYHTIATVLGKQCVSIGSGLCNAMVVKNIWIVSYVGYIESCVVCWPHGKVEICHAVASPMVLETVGGIGGGIVILVSK